ncbi:hypothetical protein MHYP_G00200500 [Metynnis hypsauchen]
MLVISLIREGDFIYPRLWTVLGPEGLPEWPLPPSPPPESSESFQIAEHLQTIEERLCNLEAKVQEPSRYSVDIPALQEALRTMRQEMEQEIQAIEERLNYRLQIQNEKLKKVIHLEVHDLGKSEEFCSLQCSPACPSSG